MTATVALPAAPGGVSQVMVAASTTTTFVAAFGGRPADAAAAFGAAFTDGLREALVHGLRAVAAAVHDVGGIFVLDCIASLAWCTRLLGGL